MNESVAYLSKLNAEEKKWTG